MSFEVRLNTILAGCCVAASLWIPRGSVAAESPSEIEAVVDLARSAPPELASDAMIRLAGLDETPAKRRVELLEQAFQMAAASPEPYKRRPALARAQGPSGFLSRVFGQDLDTLSLRLRAVDGLLPLDPKKARLRFEEIPPLALPSLTCDDFLVYDVRRFYEVLGRVAGQSFTPKEIKEEDRAKFLAGYVGGISSAVQIEPVANLLGTGLLTDAEFPVLVTAFSGALSRISGDDRSATFAAREAGNSILALSELSQRRQVSPTVVLQAYRSFLVSHLSGVRCEELPGENADPAAFFNDKLRASVLPPISDSERTPAKVEGKAKGLAWCENPECQAIRDQYHALIFRKEDGEAIQQSERERDEWQTGVRDFLAAMSSWTQSSSGTQAAFFREKIACNGNSR